MSSTRTEILFIENNVTDYQTLLAAVQSGVEVHLLDANQNGLLQMAQTLTGRNGIDAIHLISHGAPGTLNLGTLALNSQNMQQHSIALATIGEALAPGADILLYGCNVAQGDVGLQFITSLAQVTGTDVAASDDATGAVPLGGDGVLEQVSGNVEAASLPVNRLTGLLAVNTAPTFGLITGRVTTDLGSNDSGSSITLQPDGKILVAGNFALARYNANGSLDTSFDTDGKLSTIFGGIDAGSRITLQPDGKILVAGSSGVDFALARYNANGSLDTSFDTDGNLTTDFGGFDYGNSITLQPDGKILVAGSAGTSSGRIIYNFALARYNTDGTLDTSFDTDGKLTTDFGGSNDSGSSITLQPDGKILVAGYGSSFDFALARYNANGSLDTSFDTDGKLTTDFFRSADYGRSITLQPDGKILVAGTAYNSSSDFALARYNANGSLDTSFDTDGKLTTDFGGIDSGSSITLQPDGKILVAGNAGNSSGTKTDFALARYNANGSLDASFGNLVSHLDGNPTYTGSSWVVLEADVQVFDAELQQANTYGGSILTLARHAGADVNDVFSAKASGTLSALTSGSFFSVSGVTIGLVVNNSNGTLQLGFNSSATQALVSTAMQQIAYENTATIPPVQAQIDWTFSDGNTGAQGSGGALAATGSTVVNITARNVAPVLANALADISLLPNTSLNYILPTTAFFDANAGDILIFSISMNDGTALPTWLAFDPATRTFSGNPGTPGSFDLNIFDIKITAKDRTGATVSDVFALTVGSTISGSATQGQTLTAGKDLVSTENVSYQWLSNGQPISGETGNTLVLGQTQVGKTITVTATYSINGGTPASVTSVATVAVANVNDSPVGAVTIAGIPTQGQTLVASNTLADLDGMGVVSYQWKAGGVAITGATNNSLTLTQAQVGKTISVTASYTDGYGAIESATSSASATVANVNDLPTGEVTITGTPTQGQTVTASNTLADLDGMGVVSYQWKAGGVAITGATSGTFTLTSDEVGKTITVEARYTDGFGTAEGKTSSATATVASSDTTPPTATAFSPVDEASEVAVGSNIVVTFSEPISRGTGNILLKTAAGVTVATYDAATSANIDISGNTLTINPSSDLAKDTGYTVEFAAGSVKDTMGNPYAGTSSYNFTTVAGTASVITLSPATTSITEGDTGSQSLNFTVTLSVASNSTVTVNYATANGTATAGSDYTATSGTLSFAAGETSKTITVSVLGDKTVESNENFTLVLSSPSGATLGSTASATVTIIDNDSTTVLPSFTVPGTLGNDFFIPSGGNNYLGGGGSDTYIISPYTLSGAVTAKITDTEGANVIQLVDGLTIASSSFYGNAAQLTLSNGASVQILGAAAFTYLVGANTPAGDTASSQTYAQFAATLGASVPTSSTPVSGMANFQVPIVTTPANAPSPATAGTAATVPGTLGNDFFLPSGGNNYLGGGGNDTYIISSYALSGAVTAKITDTEGANVIQLVDGLTIASSSFYGNAVQLMLSNGAKVQILGAAAFGYQVGANAPAGDTASSQTYAQFAATLGASVPTGSTPVSGTSNFVVSPNVNGTFTLTAASSSVNEGSTATFSLITTNVAAGTAVAYTISGTGITAADLASGALTGAAVVGADGKATISVDLKADAVTEGAEALTVTLDGKGANATTVVNDTSTTPLLSTYALTAASSSVNEGTKASFTVTTTNVANGTVLNYTLSGTGITSADITGGALAGTVTINNNIGTISVPLALDATTEGNETLNVTVNGKTASTTIVDTSVASSFLNVNLSTGTVVATAAAEAFVYDYKMVNGRATKAGDGEVTITGFDLAKDKLVFNDIGTGTVYTKAQFLALLGVITGDDPFFGAFIYFDLDNGFLGGVSVTGVTSSAITVETLA